MDWIIGTIGEIEIEWLRREVVIPVNTNKELLSIKVAGTAIQGPGATSGAGYFDLFLLKRNLTDEKIIGSEVTYIPIEAVSAGTAFETPVFGAVKVCRIVAAHIIPKATITGGNTNYMQLQIVRKSDDAIISTKTYLAGVDSPAYEVSDFGPVNESNAVLALNDGVSFKVVHTGGGLALPDSVLVLQWNLA